MLRSTLVIQKYGRRWGPRLRGGRRLAVIEAQQQRQLGPQGSSGAIMFFSDVLSWVQIVRPIYSFTNQSLDVSHTGKGHDLMLDGSLQLR